MATARQIRGRTGVSFTITGDKALLATLSQFNAVQLRRIIRPAVSRAVTPLNKEAKRRSPVRYKYLRKSLGKKVGIIKKAGVVYGYVGARSDSKFTGRGPDKTRRGTPKKHVPWRYLNPLHQLWRPFLRESFVTTRGRMASIFGAELRKNIPKEIERARRRSARRG